jgi:hypothetical protein
MGHRPAVLVNDEYNRQTSIQQLTFTLGSRLMHSFEDILKRNYGDYRRHHIMSFDTAHHRRCNGERHLLSRTNNLWPAYNHPASAHFCQHFANALINFFTLYDIRLKRFVQLARHGPDGEGDEIRIFLESFLEAGAVSALFKCVDSTSNLEGAR